MLYAQGKLDDAHDAVAVALDAAESSKQYALYIKLSNNMGAVLRKLERHDEGKTLHSKALEMAKTHFGPAHATATLARGNLVDVMEGLGDTEGARKLLLESIEELGKVVEEKEAAEEAAAAGGAGAGEKAAEGGEEAEAAAEVRGWGVKSMGRFWLVNKQSITGACKRWFERLCTGCGK
jgi:tetratricopeptide (TPR) repeat protein